VRTPCLKHITSAEPKIGQAKTSAQAVRSLCRETQPGATADPVFAGGTAVGFTSLHATPRRHCTSLSLHINVFNCDGPTFLGAINFRHNLLRLWLARVGSIGTILNSGRGF
jgi:hypothetical protein